MSDHAYGARPSGRDRVYGDLIPIDDRIGCCIGANAGRAAEQSA
jgi:hypothetical protein